MSARSTTGNVKPKKTSKVFVITLIIVGILFAIGIEKKMPTPDLFQARNYNPALTCNDAWGHETDSSAFTGDYFDVTIREGCWGGQVALPAAWNSRWHFQQVGNEGGTWIAFAFPDPYPTAGPYGPNAIVEFPNYPMRFRLQGKGVFRFYRR